MPYDLRFKNKSRRPTAHELRQAFESTSDAKLMDAVVCGCALVAYADGWVTPDEQKRMTGLIRAFEPLNSFGIEEVLQAFDEVTERFTSDPEQGEVHALRAVARIRDMKNYPDLLIETCSAIAGADGGFDEAERLAIISLCETLGLHAGDYDLLEAK